jgi:hypothetical protein
MTIKIKLSNLIYFLILFLFLFLFYFNYETFTGSLVSYDKNLDLKAYQKNPGGFTGYAFFPRSNLNETNTSNVSNISSIKPYNGYKLLKEHDEYIPENGNLTILPKGTKFKYMKTDVDKNANGILDTNEVNTIPQTQENDFIDKFTVNFIGKYLGKMSENDNTTSNTSSIKDVSESIEFLKKLFINFLNKNSNLNFIALHHGDPDININVSSKEFIIPFFIYESKLNYTRAITVTFQANKNKELFDIFIKNINNAQLTELDNDSLKLSSATVNKSIFEKSILDTNGYYTIYNSLGLMFPFLTSPNTITNNSSNLKSESEGQKINVSDFIKEINKFNSLNLL